MDYVKWLNLKATVLNGFEFFLTAIVEIAKLILKLIRFAIYIVSSFAFAIISIFFPIGIYFAIRVIIDIANGNFSINNFGFFIFLFLVPLALGLIKELTK